MIPGLRYGHLPVYEQEIKGRYTSVQAKSVAAAARAVIEQSPTGPFRYSAGFGLPYAFICAASRDDIASQNWLMDAGS